MQTLLLSGLIGVPIVMGILAWLSPNDKLRNIIVILGAVFTGALGITTAVSGSFTLTVAFPEWLPLFLEAAILAIFLGIGWKWKNFLVLSMTGISIALLIAEEILKRPTESAAPTFIVDPLAIILILIVTIVGSLIVYFATGYMVKHLEHAPKTAATNGQFFFFLVAFLGFMSGLVVSNDLKWLSIFWEATTLCSYMLIGHDGTAEARKNGLWALIVNLFGGTALVLGGFLAVVYSGSDSLSGLMAAGALLPIALLSLAALTKSAQVPFQSWLLGAMVAPTPVSALLHSSTLVKAGSYLILRLSPSFSSSSIAPMIALIGAFTFAVTSALAISQSNAKKVLAYSTIANLGLIIVCAGIPGPLAYAAALMVLCFHAVSKGLLFLCVGTIEQHIGSRDIEDMSGLTWKMPFTTIIATIGMVSMLIPPFGMLLSKWLAIESSVNSPLVMILLVLGSALTVFFWAKWLGRIVTASYHEKYQIENIPSSMKWAMAALATGVIVAGFAAIPIYRYFIEPLAIDVSSKLAVAPSVWVMLSEVNSFMAWPLLGVMILLIVTIAITMRGVKSSQVRLPYLCGENTREGAKLSYEFRTIADKSESAYVGSYYLTPIFGEGPITTWANPIAIGIIAVIFGVLLL